MTRLLKYECGGKVTFRSPGAAKQALRILRAHGGPRRWYRCPSCHGIHVASGR